MLLAPYCSADEREAELDRLAAAAGAEMVQYGQSVQGRPLRAARVPACTDGAVPRVLCAANIHGLEYVGAQAALRLLATLADPASAAGALRNRAEVWVIPCLNPDGYARTWAQDGAGSVAELRANAHGVDLNRNFPLPGGALPSWAPGAGSSTPGHATYRGPAPLSEPETVALDALLGRGQFHAAVSFHSFMGTFIPAHVTDPQSFADYRLLCATARAAQHRPYRRLSSRRLDVFTGELEDHLHHVHRAWALTIEVFPWWASLRQHIRAPSVFWRFNPRGAEQWIAQDAAAATAFLNAALDRPRPKP